VDENPDSSRKAKEHRDKRGIFDRIERIYGILKTEQKGQEGFHAETRRRGEGEKRERDFMELLAGLTR
jgi:hypothetical protein